MNQKILVIEDETTVGINIKEILESGGFDAIVAPDGKIGIKMAKEQLPDLIVCDIMMPDMDGYGVLTALRQDGATATIPFIFLTAKTTRDDLRQGMNLGADDYLTKPFRRKELLEAIASRLAKQTKVKQLEQKIDELQQIDRQKDELIWTVSHDLRAPLANIKLIAETLKLIEPNPQQQKQYLNILETVCDQGNDLINNLLTWRKLESVEYTLEYENINLEYWLTGLLEPFEIRTRDRQQIFRIKIPPNLPHFTVDTTSLKRILTELLNNACKYTCSGGQIKFQVIYQPASSPTNPAVTTFIIANEAEITETDLPHIFEKFYRGNQKNAQLQSGTGLGLAIVQQLVEKLQGTIQAESSSGWTRFTVKLPALGNG
ncbi:response regulator [Microseira sp. BLCC-F43]|jgi:signal transduction histidine kinase|uniref:hybrid sensor histidine kinase/response regulator n=1 Tax=Microseira sp. BLCC-F43 TaxID=3153602 RepID=UPI0035B98B88